jgi:elongation factor P
MAYQTSDIRKGLKVEMDGHPYVVADFQFVKPGKGQAFTRTRLKNLLTGQVIERSFRTGEVLEEADIADANMQYLYNDADGYHFMNLESYDQVAIQPDSVGDAKKWLYEQMQVQVLFYKGLPVNIDVPNFVELEVTYCEPGVRGNTAQGTTKTATMSTGATVQVPLFIDQGEWIKVDTRTGDYVERVKR